MPSPKRILLLDDDPGLANSLLRAFRSRGAEMFIATTVAAAIALATMNAIEVALVDVFLDTTDECGLDSIPELTPLVGHVVVVSGSATAQTAVEALHLGALTFVSKPFGYEDLISAIGRAGQLGGVGQGTTDLPARRPELHLEWVEWAHIQRVLLACSHNITQAAQILGIDRRTLQRKITKRPRSYPLYGNPPA